MKTNPFSRSNRFTGCGSNPALQKDRQVLFDFRSDRSRPQPKISTATERNVLSKVFRRYLTDQTSAILNSTRATAPILWRPLARPERSFLRSPTMATGSFTAPGQSQTLYVISVGECNASHADNFGTKRVAIFSGQQLVADVDVDFKASIERKTDLNSDGIDELLMTSGDSIKARRGDGNAVQLSKWTSSSGPRFWSVVQKTPALP